MTYLDKWMYLVSKPMIGFRWGGIIRLSNIDYKFNNNLNSDSRTNNNLNSDKKIID